MYFIVNVCALEKNKLNLFYLEFFHFQQTFCITHYGMILNSK